MDLFKMLGDVEGGIIEKEPLSHSNAIEYGNEFEQKVLSLLKEKKIIVIEMLNQGIKRNAYFKIAPNHDSNETNWSYYQKKIIWKRSFPKYLKDMKDEMVQEPNLIQVVIKVHYTTDS